MIGTPDQDKFIRSMKAAIVTSLRKDGSPTSSLIFYALDGDELLFSTTSDRIKAKTLKRDPRIAVAVLDEGAPWRYATIEGTASINDGDIVPDHILINRAMRAQPDWQPPEGYEDTLRQQRRVVIRVKAQRVSGVVNRG